MLINLKGWWYVDLLTTASLNSTFSKVWITSHNQEWPFGGEQHHKGEFIRIWFANFICRCYRNNSKTIQKKFSTLLFASTSTRFGHDLRCGRSLQKDTSYVLILSYFNDQQLVVSEKQISSFFLKKLLVNLKVFWIK